jgi:hypothetical protein
MNWEAIGWRVRARFKELENRVRPKDHIELLRSLLPDRYSPLQPNGNGIQSVYLTSVPEMLAEALPARLPCRRGSYAGEASGMDFARMGQPGESRTLDHGSVTRRANRSRSGAFRRFGQVMPRPWPPLHVNSAYPTWRCQLHRDMPPPCRVTRAGPSQRKFANDFEKPPRI